MTRHPNGDRHTDACTSTTCPCYIEGQTVKQPSPSLPRCQTCGCPHHEGICRGKRGSLECKCSTYVPAIRKLPRCHAPTDLKCDICGFVD